MEGFAVFIYSSELHIHSYTDGLRFLMALALIAATVHNYFWQGYV